MAIRQGPNYKSARTGTMYWGSQVHLFEFVITNDDAQRVYARHALGWSCFYRHWQGTNTISFELSQVQPEGLDRFEPMRASGLQRMCSQAHCLRPPIRGCQSTIHDTPACGKSYCEHHLWYGSSGDKSREAYSCPQCCKIYFERKGPVGQGYAASHAREEKGASGGGRRGDFVRSLALLALFSSCSSGCCIIL